MTQQGATNLPGKILVVDDDPSVAQAVEEPLSRYGIKIDKATNLETAMYMFNQSRYEVALIELEFAPLPGLALVQRWRSHELAEKRCCAFILLSGNKTTGTNDTLIKELGDLEILIKPFSTVQILPYLSRALATKKRTTAYQEMRDKVVSYYEKTKDFAKAAEEVQKKLPELGARGLPILYDLYEKAGKFDEALAIVNPILEKEPNNIAYLNAKGRLLMRLGRFQDAKNILAKCDELAPENIERLNELAIAQLELNDPAGSVKRFKQILKLNPDNPDLKFEMYSKLYERGHDDHAIQFGKETAKPMEIVRYYNNKGVMLSKDGKVGDALTEYKRALGFFPQFKENYRIHYNVALAKMQAKTRDGYAEAVKSLKTCLQLSPDFDKAKKTLETLEKALAPKKAS